MIPKTIHFNFFWEEPPEWVLENVREWQERNPDFEIVFWDDLPDMEQKYVDAIEIPERYCHKADLVREWILYRYGGIYVDVDTRPIRPLADWLLEEEAFAIGMILHGTVYVDNYFMGSEPKSRALGRALELCLDQSQWDYPHCYFGSCNTLMEGDRLVDGLTRLPTSFCKTPLFRTEMLEMESRDQLDDSKAFLKHYEYHANNDLDFPQDVLESDMALRRVKEAKWRKRREQAIQKKEAEYHGESPATPE